MVTRQRLPTAPNSRLPPKENHGLFLRPFFTGNLVGKNNYFYFFKTRKFTCFRRGSFFFFRLPVRQMEIKLWPRGLGFSLVSKIGRSTSRRKLALTRYIVHISYCHRYKGVVGKMYCAIIILYAIIFKIIKAGGYL